MAVGELPDGTRLVQMCCKVMFVQGDDFFFSAGHDLKSAL